MSKETSLVSFKPYAFFYNIKSILSIQGIQENLSITICCYVILKNGDSFSLKTNEMHTDHKLLILKFRYRPYKSRKENRAPSNKKHTKKRDYCPKGDKLGRNRVRYTPSRRTDYQRKTPNIVGFSSMAEGVLE